MGVKLHTLRLFLSSLVCTGELAGRQSVVNLYCGYSLNKCEDAGLSSLSVTNFHQLHHFQHLHNTPETG